MSEDKESKRLYIGPNEFVVGNEYKFWVVDKKDSKWYTQKATPAFEDSEIIERGFKFKRHDFLSVPNGEYKKPLMSDGPFYGKHRILDVETKIQYKRYVMKNPFADTPKKTTKKKRKKKPPKKNVKKNVKKNKNTNTNTNDTQENENDSDYIDSDHSSSTSIIANSDEEIDNKNKKKYQSKKTLTKEKQKHLANESNELTLEQKKSIEHMREILKMVPANDNINEALKYIDIFEEHSFYTQFKWNFVEKAYNESLSLINNNMKNMNKNKNAPQYNESMPRYNNKPPLNDTKSDKKTTNISKDLNKNDSNETDSKKNDSNTNDLNINENLNANDLYYHKDFCIYCDSLVNDAIKHMENTTDKKHVEGNLFTCRFTAVIGGTVMCGAQFCNEFRLWRHHHTQHSLWYRRTEYLPENIKCKKKNNPCADKLQCASYDGNKKKWRMLWCSGCKQRFVAKTIAERAAIEANVYSNRELDDKYPIDWQNKIKTSSNNSNNSIANKPIPRIINKAIVDSNSNENKNDKEYTSQELNDNKFVQCGFCMGFFPKNTLIKHMKEMHYD